MVGRAEERPNDMEPLPGIRLPVGSSGLSGEPVKETKAMRQSYAMTRSLENTKKLEKIIRTAEQQVAKVLLNDSKNANNSLSAMTDRAVAADCILGLLINERSRGSRKRTCG